MWREGYVPGGDTRFFVRALGSPGWREPARDGDREDELIVLLHGFPEDGSAWRRVAPMLVDAGYRVVCPDLKGFGRSDAPRRGYDAPTLADEISQLIRNLHARKAVLVGHDWGGAVALATAFRHPGRVRALVVASAPFRQLDLIRSWHIPLMNVPVLPELAYRLAARRLVAAGIHHTAVIREPFTDEVVDGYAEMVKEHPRSWLAYYRTLSRRAVRDWTIRRLRSQSGLLRDADAPHHLRIPATVIWGELDPVTPHHLAPQVARDLDASLVTLPGVGHFVHEEDPLGFTRAVVDLAGPGAHARAQHPAATRDRPAIDADGRGEDPDGRAEDPDGPAVDAAG